MRNTLADFFRTFRKTIIIWFILTTLVVAAYYFGVPKKFIGGGVLTIGWITGAFAGLLAMIGLIPVVGPIVVSVLSLPIFWILNGLGYFVSIIAIKKGYTRQVVGSRVLTMAFLFGLICGFVIAKIIELF